MEPLTALALAGNVLQFIDFGCKLLSMTGELYKSSTGSLAVHDEIELVTTDLQFLVKKLRHYPSQTSPATTTTFPDPGYQEGLISFVRVCEEAANVAQELLGRLNGLKATRKLGKLRSLQYAIRSLWNEKEVAGLMKRLAALKETLEIHVLSSIRESIDADYLRTSVRFDSLDKQTQQILSAMLESSNRTSHKMSKEFHEGMHSLEISIAQLLCRLEQTNEDSHRTARDKIAERLSTRNEDLAHLIDEQQQITAGIEMLDVSDAVEQQLRASVTDAIIQSLIYVSMNNRYEDVIEAHPDTFEWAFKNSTEQKLPWHNLSQWLESDDGVYWVCGKAGSGKSTFMKHVFDSSRTRDYLRKWAGKQPMCIASFFFWNSGTREQKSQIGLLRSLLFQVLHQCPAVVPVVLPELWAQQYSKALGNDGLNENLSGFWTLRRLRAALENIIRQDALPLKIMFLIDGLDEFDGDHEEIGKLFHTISSSRHIKVCLSSRPWVVFEHLFECLPMLRLQNLTYHDIEKYVGDKVRANVAYQRLLLQECDTAKDLAREIVHKADGVFLWVKLVVQSLLNGIRNRDEVCDLRERLRLMPRELEPLYQRLLELIEPMYLPWVSKTIQILRATTNTTDAPFTKSSSKIFGVSPLNLCSFFLAINENVDVATLQVRIPKPVQGNSQEKLPLDQLVLPAYSPTTEEDGLTSTTKTRLYRKCEDTSVQLTARCAGFLEVPNTTSGYLPYSPIQYFHRTARDFLESETIWSKLLLQTRESGFNPNTTMMRSCLIKLQIAPLVESSSNADNEHDIQRVAEDFMIYAHHADAHHQSKATQVALLLKMDHAMKRHDSRWIIKMCPRAGGFPTFLEIAALYGLQAFVSQETPKQGQTRFRELDTSILLYLVPSIDRHVYTGMPLPKVEMVQTLLSLGADPNVAGNTESVWKRLLSFHTNEENDYSNDETYDATVLQRRYIEIMSLLVLPGSDPEAKFLDCRINGRSTAEFIRNIVAPKHPLEAAPLLQEIRSRIQSKQRNVKRKRGVNCRELKSNTGAGEDDQEELFSSEEFPSSTQTKRKFSCSKRRSTRKSRKG